MGGGGLRGGLAQKPTPWHFAWQPRDWTEVGCGEGGQISGELFDRVSVFLSIIVWAMPALLYRHRCACMCVYEFQNVGCVLHEINVSLCFRRCRISHGSSSAGGSCEAWHSLVGVASDGEKAAGRWLIFVTKERRGGQEGAGGGSLGHRGFDRWLEGTVGVKELWNWKNIRKGKCVRQTCLCFFGTLCWFNILTEI